MSSETFTVTLPLKCTMQVSEEGLCGDPKYAGFQKFDTPLSFVVDCAFVRLYDSVKGAINNGKSLIYIKGLHRCFGLWLRLVFELLASNDDDSFSPGSSCTSGGSIATGTSDTSALSYASSAPNVSSVASEKNSLEWNFFFIEFRRNVGKYFLFSAFGGNVVSKRFPSLDQACDFACSFDNSIVFYAGLADCTSAADKRVFFVMGESPDIEEKASFHEIDIWESGYKMAVSYPVFAPFIKMYYEGEFEGRDVNTLYYICSGRFDILDKMIAERYVLFTNADRSIDFYIGSPTDNDDVSKLGKTIGNNQGFFDQIQFDEVPIVVDKVRTHVATTIVLCKPTVHDENVPIMGSRSGTSESINFPKPSSDINQNLYILSPSESMLNKAVDVAKAADLAGASDVAETAKTPKVFNGVQLPGYLTKNDPPLKNDRWHLAVENSSLGRLVVKTPILFSVSAKILYAMVEAWTQNVNSIECRSWHITGIYGTGKSTALLTCQYLWFQRPSTFRVSYLPYSNMFQKDRSLFETFKLLLCIAFLRDPIQHLLFMSIEKIMKSGKVSERKILTGLFTVLQSYLESQNLFYVIIIDQLNKIWDKSGDFETSAYNFVEFSLRPIMRGDEEDSKFNRILLITAASLNNSAAPARGNTNEDLNIDFFNGFNEFESGWMIDRFFESRVAEASEIKKLTEPLGVRPIDNDFTVDAIDLKVGTSSANPIINDTIVAERIVEVKKTVSGRFTTFAKENAALEIDKYNTLMNVLYFNVLNSCDYNTIDRRVVKPVLCPRLWDPLKDDVIGGNLNLNVMPLPITDTTEYEDWLLKPKFREALSLASPQVCLLACSQLARQALHEVHLKNLGSNVCVKLFENAPSCAGFVFEEAFELDILNSGMTSIQAHRVKLVNLEMEMESEPTELFNFAKVNYHKKPSALITANGRQRMMNMPKRLVSVGIQPDGCLNLFRMRLNEAAIDFCLIQNFERNPQCVVVQNAITNDVGTLKNKLLVTAYMVVTQRQARLPILFAKDEPARLLFVCGPNFFAEQVGGDVPPEAPSSASPAAKKPREMTRNGEGAAGKLPGRKVFKADPARTAGADGTNECKNWSLTKLMAEVEQLVRQGKLEIYVVAVENEPEGSFDISRSVYKKYVTAKKEAVITISNTE